MSTRYDGDFPSEIGDEIMRSITHCLNPGKDSAALCLAHAAGCSALLSYNNTSTRQLQMLVSNTGIDVPVFEGNGGK